MANDCTKKSKRCDNCRAAATKISSAVPASALLCTSETNPMTIECSGKGTKDQVCELITRLKSSLGSCTTGPIRVAARRPAENGKPARRWRDYTKAAGFGYKASKTLMKAPTLIGRLDAEKLINEQFPEKRKKWQDRIGTARELTILVDFSSEVARGGDFEGIVKKACGEIYELKTVKYPNGDANLHRLQWFAKVFPEERDEEEQAVVITKRGHVRKKRSRVH
ncbi:hypothetical protein BDW69DRAFT_199441 [Aspergillus filifer]